MRRELLWAVLLGAVAVGWASCASSPKQWVGYCDSQEVFESPSAECAEDPAALQYADEMRQTLDGAGSPLAVLVTFDTSSKVDHVCLVRSDAPDQWGGNRALNDNYPDVIALPAGPACLAGKTLIFNQEAAEIGGLKAAMRDCRWRGIGGGAGDSGAYDRICVRNAQARRNEIWFFNTHRDYPYVFEPAREDRVNAQSTISFCTDDIGIVPTEMPEITLGFTRSLSRLEACVEPRGWKRKF